MGQKINNVTSVLGIHVGTVNTRAALFDIVQRSYRFLAQAEAQSTYEAPTFDAREGAYQAIRELEERTGAVLFDENGWLQVGLEKPGCGVGKLVMTTSCGSNYRSATLGLLEGMSLGAVNHLARSILGPVTCSIGINDHRTASDQLDELIRHSPEFIIFSGGSEGGASRSVLQLARLVTQLLQVTPRENRPIVFYCGNSTLGQQLKESVDHFTRVRVSQNVHPGIDRETLAPAQRDLGEMLVEVEALRVGGLGNLARKCSVPAIPDHLGVAEVVRFLGRKFDPAKGALGISLEDSDSFVSYANHQSSISLKFPYGNGQGTETLLRQSDITDVTTWLDGSKSDEFIRDSLLQAALFSGSIPASAVDLEIKLAFQRHLITRMMADLETQNQGIPRCFEPILVSSDFLNRVPDARQVLLTILDGVQPLGITQVILDSHCLLGLIGASARLNPVLSAQLLESSVFTKLATVVNIRSRQREGTTLVAACLEKSGAFSEQRKVKKGTLVTLPLEPGEEALLHIRKVHSCEIEDVDMPGVPIKVTGSVCGVVIDARGRPLKIPDNVFERREAFKTWHID